MPKQVEARFECHSRVKKEYRYGGQTDVTMHATTDEESWKEFTDSTPCGDIELTVADGYPAAEFFEPGETYKVTFEKVDDE